MHFRAPFVAIAILGLASLNRLCGLAHRGPSPVTAIPSLTSFPAFPAGVDPAYVRALAVIDPAGVPKRWEGGPFHHCLAASVDPPQVQGAIAMMSEVSGIPTTTEGPCNVDWVVDDEAVRNAGAGEAGHFLGLGHSPRPRDMMAPNFMGVTEPTADERAVLLWIYTALPIES